MRFVSARNAASEITTTSLAKSVIFHDVSSPKRSVRISNFMQNDGDMRDGDGDMRDGDGAIVGGEDASQSKVGLWLGSNPAKSHKNGSGIILVPPMIQYTNKIRNCVSNLILKH